MPAHMLHDIVRKLPEGSQVDIRRDTEKDRLTLAAGHELPEPDPLRPMKRSMP